MSGSPISTTLHEHREFSVRPARSRIRLS